MDIVLKKKKAPEWAVVAIEVKREAVFDHFLVEVKKARAGEPITNWRLDKAVKDWRSIVVKVLFIFLSPHGRWLISPNVAPTVAAFYGLARGKVGPALHSLALPGPAARFRDVDGPHVRRYLHRSPGPAQRQCALLILLQLIDHDDAGAKPSIPRYRSRHLQDAGQGRHHRPHAQS